MSYLILKISSKLILTKESAYRSVTQYSFINPLMLSMYTFQRYIRLTPKCVAVTFFFCRVEKTACIGLLFIQTNAALVKPPQN